MNEIAVEKVRLSVADWERGALSMIAEQGVQAVAVEPLARRLGVTKGSFYWHFHSREALLKAALARWEHHDQESLDAIALEFVNPRERLAQLFRRVARRRTTHAIYSALIAARDQPVVSRVMERVSARRMMFLAEAYLALGLATEAAQHQARLAYAAFVGFLQLSPQGPEASLKPKTFDAYLEHVIDVLVPAE